MKILRILYALWRQFTCAPHYFVTEASTPGSLGIIVKRRCTRCDAIEYTHQPIGRGRP